MEAPPQLPLSVATQQLILQSETPNLPSRYRAAATFSKPKTRGAPWLPVGAEQDQAPDPEPPLGAVLVASDTFETLNFILQITKEQQSTEWPWKRVRQAFGELGFICRILPGSIWNFTRSQAGYPEQKITLHGPHRSPNISYHVYGIRLRVRNVFGWNDQTFALSKKDQ